MAQIAVRAVERRHMAGRVSARRNTHVGSDAFCSALIPASSKRAGAGTMP